MFSVSTEDMTNPEKGIITRQEQCFKITADSFNNCSKMKTEKTDEEMK